MPLFLERLHNAFFVRGRKTRKHIHGFHGLGQLRVGHRFHLAADQDFFRVNADFAAYLAGDEVVVAGQNLDRHPMLPQSLDGLGRGVLGGIEEREVSGQNQIALVGLGKGGLIAELLCGDRQHAKTVFAQFIHLLDQVAGQNRLHRKNLALALKVRAFGKHCLRRTLGQKLPLAIRSFDGHRHHTP